MNQATSIPILFLFFFLFDQAFPIMEADPQAGLKRGSNPINRVYILTSGTRPRPPSDPKLSGKGVGGEPPKDPAPWSADRYPVTALGAERNFFFCRGTPTEKA